MSTDNDASIEDAREAEVVTRHGTMKGDVIKNAAGDLLMKVTGGRGIDPSRLSKALSDDEQAVTVWVQITDKVSKQLLEEGQSLLAWVRVKRMDGKFVRKTTLFSLGAVAAVTITRHAIHHYKSR